MRGGAVLLPTLATGADVASSAGSHGRGLANERLRTAPHAVHETRVESPSSCRGFKTPTHPSHDQPDETPANERTRRGHAETLNDEKANSSSERPQSLT